MNTNNINTLTLQVFMEAVDSALNGDLTAALDMGLNHEQILWLKDLKVEDVNHLVASGSKFMTFQINPELFLRAQEYLDHESQVRQLETDCLLSGANYDMMNAFFGWSSLAFSQRCCLHELKKGGGRPKNIELDEEHVVHKAWTKVKPNINHPAARYLAVHQDTKIDMCRIWRIVKETQDIERSMEGATVTKLRVGSHPSR